MKPLVSIIIPTYNRAHLISETLDSILAQTYANWECIVVDDGSKDNTEEIVVSYAKNDNRFQFHKRLDKYKPGGNGARNYGFELSKGEYINWFDSDDLMHPEKLERQLALLHNSDYNFCVCQTFVFEENRNHIIGLRHEKIISNQPLLDFVTRDIIFLTQAPILKREFINKHSLFFNEELKAAQDWEFFCRVIYYSPKYLITNEPLVYVRKHTENISNNLILKEITNWHNCLARFKVLDFVKKHQVDNKKKIIDSIQKYLSGKLYFYCINREYKKAFKIYYQGFFKTFNFLKCFKVGIVMIVFITTKRGYNLRRYI